MSENWIFTKYEKLPISKSFSFIAGVVDTGYQPLLSNISKYFSKNSKWAPWYTQGPGGNWFMKKTWSRKSGVRLPLNMWHCTYKDRAFKYFESSINRITSVTLEGDVECTLQFMDSLRGKQKKGRES